MLHFATLYLRFLGISMRKAETLAARTTGWMFTGPAQEIIGRLRTAAETHGDGRRRGARFR